MSEELIYRAHGVTVTNTLLTGGGQTFFIKNLHGVTPETRKDTPGWFTSIFAFIFLIGALFGIILGVSGINQATNGTESGLSIVMLVSCLAVIVSIVSTYMKKPYYSIMLHLGQNDPIAFLSTKSERVAVEVSEAIRTAIHQN